VAKLGRHRQLLRPWGLGSGSAPDQIYCNKFIHSFVFVPREGERGGLDGLYFTSDQEKDRKLFLIDIDAVIEISNVLVRITPSRWNGVAIRRPAQRR
jgi:hypothetical protein